MYTHTHAHLEQLQVVVRCSRYCYYAARLQSSGPLTTLPPLPLSPSLSVCVRPFCVCVLPFNPFVFDTTIKRYTNTLHTHAELRKYFIIYIGFFRLQVKKSPSLQLGLIPSC